MSREYLREFSKKFEMAVTIYSGNSYTQQIFHRCQRHQRQILPPFLLVLLIPVANLPPVSTIPAAKLPLVSTTPVANCHWCQRRRRQIATGINDTRRWQIATGVNDTGGKLPPVSMILAANLPPVSTTPVANCHRYQRYRRQICHRYQRHRWQTMGTISGCRYLKVNLKAKMYIYANSATQRCPNKIIKIFLIEDFFHLPPVSLISVVHLEPRISRRIFEKIRNGRNDILRCLGETDS